MAITVSFKSKVNKNGQSNKYTAKSLFVVLLFVAFVVVEIFMEVLFNSSYLDEILGLLSMFYLAAFIRKIEKKDAITILILFFVILIGIISNILNATVSSAFSILVDIVTETKFLFAFFAMKYFLSPEEKQRVINMLTPFSRLFVLSAFICALISQFIDTRMTAGERYGLKSFHFIFVVNVQYVSVFMFIFGIIVCNTKMSERKKNQYYFMALVSIALAAKGVSTIFCLVFIFLFFYFRKHEKISLPVFIIGAIVIIALSQYQINTYLLDEESPRHLFTKYSMVTANKYFPLGSGFASFGSDQAAKNYSSLYYEYGFYKLRGMNPVHGQYLSDNFWQMAIGQFGWIGAALYLFVFISILLSFNNKSLDYKRKALLYAIFIQYMIQAIGSATLSSSYGMIGFLALALFSAQDYNKKPKRKINIRL